MGKVGRFGRGSGRRDHDGRCRSRDPVIFPGVLTERSGFTPPAWLRFRQQPSSLRPGSSLEPEKAAGMFQPMASWLVSPDGLGVLSEFPSHTAHSDDVQRARGIEVPSFCYLTMGL